ncbi:MAG: tetratricopeptide repeat protein [Flavobacteriaceae bacterium]|nr:tetratricopeptide repeat protein [Flavobacteriaceae bacterium]
MPLQKRIIFLVSGFLCMMSTLHSQEPGENIIDSLLAIPSISDSLKLAKVHSYLWQEKLFSDPSETFELAKKQYAYAVMHRNLEHQAKALNTQGVSFGLRANPNEAIYYYTRSLDIRKRIGDKRGIANTLSNIGLSQIDLANYADAIQNFTESLKIHEELGNIKGQANALNNIGLIYQSQNNHQESIRYFKKCQVLMQKDNNEQGLALAYTNLGLGYTNLAQYKEAMEYYNKSLALHEKLNDIDGRARTLGSLSEIYLGNDHYEEAMRYAQQSLSLRERIGDNRGISESLTKIARIHFENRKFDEAIVHGKRAMQFAKKNDGVFQIRDAAQVLSDTYREKGDYKSSLLMYERLIVARDSILSEKNREEIVRQELTYQFEKQKAIDDVESKRKLSIAEKEKEKSRIQLLAVSIVAVLIIVFFGILYQRYSIIRKQKKTIELQYQNIEEKTEQIIQIEKEKHERELELKRKDMETVVAHNKFQIKLKENLSDALRLAYKSNDVKKEVKNIMIDLKMQVEKQQKLSLVEENMQEINAQFFETLQEKHPNISKTEREICVYIKLGLSTKEIASLRNTTVNTINVTKTRLRNKLGLATNSEIYPYLLKV